MSKETSSTNQKPRSRLHTLAIVSSVIGGGVVGHDYARWAEVDPKTGAVTGFIIGVILVCILEGLKKQEKEIEKSCIGIGVFFGGLSGGIAGGQDGGGPGGFFAGMIIGSIMGAIAGAMVSALISFIVLALLFISQGPVGFFLRSVVLSHFKEVEAEAEAEEPMFQLSISSVETTVCESFACFYDGAASVWHVALSV